MEGLFWFIFGIVTGMSARPHLQRLIERARRLLAELDDPEDAGRAPHEEPGRWT